MSRNWVKIAVIVVVLFVVAIFIASMAVSANTFRPALESRLSEVLGRQVTLGNLNFSLFSGSLVANNIAVADDPAFSATPFLQAKALHIGVEVWPLIFHRKLVVTSFTADEPAIHLIRGSNGVWNFSSLSAGASKKAAGGSAVPNFTVGVITIRGGSATVSSRPATGKPLLYSKLEVAAQQFSASKSFPFQVSAQLPGGGTLAMQGTAGPINGHDAAATPLNAKLDLNHFDPVAAGVVDPKQGISMVANIAAHLVSDGKTLAATGTVNASHLKLVAHGAPAPKPVKVQFSVHENLATQEGTVDSLDLGTGAVAASVTGTFAGSAQPATLNLNVSMPKVPVNQVEDLLPTVGVRLPSGSRLSGGTITANLKVSGPANALNISGPVEIDGTRLAGFDLGSKIGGLKPVGGSQGGTEIQTLRANVASSPSSTRIENLYVAVPALGTATGGGTVTPAGALNFHVVAKLNPNGGVAGQALAGLTSAGSLGSLLGSVASKGIPIDISGTTANPVIQADVNSMIKRNAGGLLRRGLRQPDAGSLLNKYLPH